MPSHVEIQRIAAATHALRPDWPIASLVSLLTARQAARAYTDLAVAMTVIACDSTTRTPARVNEMGPWWTAVSGYSTPTVGPGVEPRCTRDGHECYAARNCAACRSERLAGES